MKTVMLEETFGTTISIEKGLRDENLQTHEALRLSEARNRDLVEHAVYGIARVSPEGTFLTGIPRCFGFLVARTLHG